MNLLCRVARRILGRGTQPASRGATRPLDDRTAQYRAWFQRHAPTPADLAHLRDAAAALPHRPLISIVTPVYNTEPSDLGACVASVLAQVYTNWEWRICNDASTSPATVAVLDAQTDPRIRVVTLERNSGISVASQTPLASAAGEFVALLDSDDEITPDALYEVVRHLNESPDTDVVYSDEDKLDEDGGCSEPFFKPDWSPEHLLSAMYTCHFTVARKALVDRTGGFRTLCEGSQDHDLMLRLTSLTSRIHHVPKILYHWRRALRSGARMAGAKPWADEAGRLAVDDHLRQKGVDAEVVSAGALGLYRARFAIRGEPLVSIVVVAPEGRAGPCVESVRERTAYRHYEIIAADDHPATSATVTAAARHAQGAHLVFLDAAIDIADEDWLRALLEYSQQEAIGAVGAKIQYADGRLRHIGLLVGVEPGVSRAMHGHPGTGYGYFSSAIGVRNYSAVSAECLMTRRELFDTLGGFNARVPWSVADVDYCLRAERAGYRTVFTPHAQVRRRQAGPPDSVAIDPAAVAILRELWGARLDRDPYYNPNLTRASSDYGLGP